MSKKELKQYLKGLQKEKVGFPDFEFEYKSGHTEFHMRLTIMINAKGVKHWKVPRGTPMEESDESNKVLKREKEFSEVELAHFIDKLIEHKVWDLENCTTRPLPDTALLTFLIKDKEKLLFKQEVWDICRNDSTRTRDILRAIESCFPAEWTPP